MYIVHTGKQNYKLAFFSKKTTGLCISLDTAYGARAAIRCLKVVMS